MTDDFSDDRDTQRTADAAPGAATTDGTAETGGAADDARAQRRAERRRRVRERTFDTTVASPCIAICQLGADDLCVGCLRSMDEIRDWPIMSATEKRAVLANIEARKSA